MAGYDLRQVVPPRSAATGADVLDLRAAQAERGLRSPLTIGGSEAGAAIGCDPYCSPVRLWTYKTGRDARPETEAMRWGTLLEPVVFDVLGNAGYEPEHAPPEGFYDPERAWLHGHPDGFCTVDGERGVLEIKTAGPWTAGAWRGDDHAPAPYLAQVMHYLALTDCNVALLAVLIGGQRLELRTVRRDDAIIAGMLEAERDFLRYVRDDLPPPVDGSDATAEALRAMFPQSQAGEVTRLDREGMRLLREYRALDAQAKAVEAQAEIRKQALQVMMGDAETALSPDDVPVLRWKARTVNRLDVKALRADSPAIADAFTATTTQRRFEAL